MMLDADRDGYVSSIDIANYLQRRCIDTSEASKDQIEQWFADYTSNPERGLDMT